VLAQIGLLAMKVVSFDELIEKNGDEDPAKLANPGDAVVR
jgi:hypothetical protein